MIVVIILISMLLAGIGWLVNEKNAKYLLSGYNTLNESQRKQFDLPGYLYLFRRFHLIMGTSLMLIGLSVFYFYGVRVGGLFLAIYPVVGYIIFAYRTDYFWRRTGSNLNKVGLVVLLISLLMVLLLFLLI